jgi:hypothetical protein
MAEQTIRVRGYRETARALQRVNKGAKAALYTGLKEAANPIAEDARSRLAGYTGMKTSTIRPRANLRGVYVTQGARKTTGLRPDFGSLQMRQGLLPALYSRQDDIVDRVETAFLVLTKLQGF